MKEKTLIAAARFHALAQCAARNGGFWVSASGGTANVVAGEISRSTGSSYEEAHQALDATGPLAWGEELWYAEMAYAQPWAFDAYHEETPGRWDARTIAKAACRLS